jgi:hypothetical protein
LFLFRGGVREGVGEEEEEEEEERERRRYGDENVLVFKMSFSSHGFPRRVPDQAGNKSWWFQDVYSIFSSWSYFGKAYAEPCG